MYAENLGKHLDVDGNGFFKGILRQAAAMTVEGKAEVREGKKPLPFQSYRRLARGKKCGVP
jgi:hypothetical protein